MGIAIVLGAQAFRRELGDPWSEIMVSLPLLALLCASGAFLLVIIEIMERKWHPPAEYTRKLAHVGAGAIALSAPVLFSTHWPVLVMVVIFSAALIVSRLFGWLASLHVPAQRGEGDILFLWAVYLVFLLAEGNILMFQIPIVVLTVGDAVAALIGQRYGRIRYRMSGTTRTVEGSMAFIGVSFLCIWPLLQGLTEMLLVHCAALSVVLATTASAVEAVSPPGLDNVSIPITTFFLLGVFLR